MRQDKAEIDLALIQEAMDKRRLGLPNAQLPPSEAKTHMATVQVRPTSIPGLLLALFPEIETV